MWGLNQLNCIIESKDGSGGIYMGDIFVAKDTTRLKKENIKAVLTVASNTYLKYNKEDISDHKIIEAEDFETFNLSQFFNECLDFIETHLKKGNNVLVHCFAGVSRSATIVIAYLMKNNKWKLNDTIKYVKSKRNMIAPNSGFGKQLQKFEENGYQI